VIDAPLAELDRITRDASAQASAGGSLFGMDAPTISAIPPAGLRGWARAQTPQPDQVRGKRVRLRHAWDLGEAAAPGEDVVELVVFSSEFHARWPWARQRWAWVGARLCAMPGPIWWGTEAQIGDALQAAASVDAVLDPHLAPALTRWARCQPEPTLFTPVTARCESFSAWWRQTQLQTTNP
jgi:hypothetical protein